MTSLRALQEDLKNLIFFREGSPPKSRLWGETIPVRLDVYRHNTRTNWTDALEHDFPLTYRQFSGPGWEELRVHYFIKHPPQHWELNASVEPFVKFLKTQKVKAFIKELADYEWSDLKVFIDRAQVKPGLGITNPTALVRAYQYQIFDWVQAGAPPSEPPLQKPEVLVFYRDGRNIVHIQEADPLMLLLMDHCRVSGACLDDLEPVRQRLLPANTIPLKRVFETLKKDNLIL